MKGLTRIERDGDIYAIVLRKEYNKPGPSFFTPGEFSQQLGMLVHPKGKEVKRHRHKLVKREIFRTQEVLLLLDGKVRVDICTDEGEIKELSGNNLTLTLTEDSRLLLRDGPEPPAGFTIQDKRL